jgi:hypothetical protein
MKALWMNLLAVETRNQINFFQNLHSLTHLYHLILSKKINVKVSIKLIKNNKAILIRLIMGTMIFMLNRVLFQTKRTRSIL